MDNPFPSHTFWTDVILIKAATETAHKTPKSLICPGALHNAAEITVLVHLPAHGVLGYQKGICLMDREPAVSQNIRRTETMSH